MEGREKDVDSPAGERRSCRATVHALIKGSRIYGRPGVRDGAAGLRLAEREEDVDTPAGEDNRAVFG